MTQNNLKISDYLVVILMGSSVLPVKFYVICAIFLVYINIYRQQSLFICKYIVPVCAIFFISSASTWINLAFNELDTGQITHVTFRFRKFFIEFFIAFSVILQLQGVTILRLAKILKVIVILNFSIAVIQFTYSGGERASMLFMEPSSAAYFILISFIPCYYLYRQGLLSKLTMCALILSSLLIFSKAFIVIVILTYVIYFFFTKGMKNKILIFFIFNILNLIVIFNWNTFIELSDQFKGFSLMLSALYNYGINGLSIEYGVYSTYVTRFSSLLASVYLFITNPFGVGYGSFGYLYEQTLNSLGIISLISGVEVDGFFSGNLVPSPKSNLLEIFIATGWLIIPIFLFIYLKYFKNNIIFSKIMFIMFVLSSFLIELNNFYLYLFFIIYCSHQMKTDAKNYEI